MLAFSNEKSRPRYDFLGIVLPKFFIMIRVSKMVADYWVKVSLKFHIK